MNLRILKKLSKRAALLLPLLGDDREQFAAEKGENYGAGAFRHERKHWERFHSIHGDTRRGNRKWVPKSGNGWSGMRPPSHPLKGTVMVGAVTGYYEPEWDEETAFGSLCSIVWDHFTDYVEINTGDCTALDVRVSRRFRNAADYFTAAQEILAGKKAGWEQLQDYCAKNFPPEE